MKKVNIMVRKIFNGIKIERLTKSEIEKIKHSDIIDRIINQAYILKDK